jgi:acetoin utilization protein AcuC
MHEASAVVTGGTVDAANAVLAGTAQHAVNLAGGLHHAMPARASWTFLLAEISGAQLESATVIPEAWRRLVYARTGQEAPRLLGEGADATYRAWDAGAGDPDDPVDRAIAATRSAVFPEHGLDPLDPR